MTPENVAAAELQPAGMGEFSRIFGIFFEPRKTFTDIAQRPTWIVPMILLILAAMATFVVASQKIGWGPIVRRQMESTSRFQQAPADQRQNMIDMQTRFAPVEYYGGVIIGVPLIDIIEAAILLGIAGGLMGGGLRFKQVFAVVCYSGIPGVISSILTIVVILLKNPEDFDIQNPLAFNAGAFMDPNTGSKVLHALATSLDLFMFWMIFLMATGLKAAAGKKLSFTGALVAVLVPWAILVMLKLGLVAAFA